MSSTYISPTLFNTVENDSNSDPIHLTGRIVPTKDFSVLENQFDPLKYFTASDPLIYMASSPSSNIYRNYRTGGSTFPNMIYGTPTELSPKV